MAELVHCSEGVSMCCVQAKGVSSQLLAAGFVALESLLVSIPLASLITLCLRAAKGRA